MELITILIIAVALGTDAFSMAIGIGTFGIKYRQIIYISFIIFIFHTFLPLLGLSLGALLGKSIGKIAAIIGASVLVLMGILMFREAVKKDEGNGMPKRDKMIVTTGFWSILILATSVSLDALTVGFGMGTLQFNLMLTVLVIGTVAGVMTALGFLLGKRLGTFFAEKAQMIGGIILIAIGVKMFFL